ncbi:MAG: hypothetical protein OEL89_01640 [Candidatus Peregrinibacteria bacterium]|nr:hypothetical protein [Candidatus Peregrinibacteria bacterium]
MKLHKRDLDKRVDIALDKNIKSDGTSGIMRFGENNDYAQKIEMIIYSSQTGFAVAKIFAEFIGGSNFENPEIGGIVVGIDALGKPVTLDSIRRRAASDIAKNNGCRIHCDVNGNGIVGKTKIVPFKYCRNSAVDDNGFSGKIAVYDNWDKDKNIKFDSKKIKWYPNFNLNKELILKSIEDGTNNGQIYSFNFDNEYIYPLSPFDSVYLDMDTEYQHQIYNNNEVRNGYSDKTVFLVQTPNDETEAKKMTDSFYDMMSPNGAKCIVLEAEFDETGNLIENKQLTTKTISSNMTPDLFTNVSKSISNNIRKAANGMPLILIDFEMGGLSTGSGEMITQAFNYYNAMTSNYRQAMSEMFKDIYSNFNNPILQNNKNWDILPFNMNQIPTAQQ